MHLKIIKNISFTLVEILIVIILLLGIFAIFSKPLLQFSQDYFTVYNDTIKIKATLEKARDNAIIGLENKDWGVYFVNSTSAYYLFSGNSFNSASNYSQFFLEQNNIFIDPSQGQTKEIIFKKQLGYTTSSQISISSVNRRITSKIFINRFGNIEFEILK